jgi:hypothetical protein
MSAQELPPKTTYLKLILEITEKECKFGSMKVSWKDGSLVIVPEDFTESQELQELEERLKSASPSGTQRRVPWGDTESGGQSLFDSLVVNHQLSPSCNSGKFHNQKHVVSIDKALKVVPNLDRCTR